MANTIPTITIDLGSKTLAELLGPFNGGIDATLNGQPVKLAHAEVRALASILSTARV